MLDLFELFEEFAKDVNKLPNPPEEITTYSKEEVLKLLAEQKKELSVNLHLCRNGLKTTKVSIPPSILALVISDMANKPVSTSELKKAELQLTELEKVTKDLLSMHTEVVTELINAKDDTVNPLEKLNSLYVSTKGISSLTEKIDENILILFIKEVIDIKREEVMTF